GDLAARTARLGTDDRGTENLAAGALGDDLGEAFRLTLDDGPRDVPVTHTGHVDREPLGAGFGLQQPNRGRLGDRVDRPRHQAPTHPPPPTATGRLRAG